MTTEAFDRGLPGQGGYIVAIAMAMFAVSTAITQAYYGNRAADYLFGEKAAVMYRWFYCLTVFAGAITALQLVWTLADIANALVCLPNLLTLVVLSGYIVDKTRGYFSVKQLTREELLAKDETVA